MLKEGPDFEIEYKIRLALERILEERPEKPITQFIQYLKEGLIAKNSPSPSPSLSGVQISHKHFVFQHYKDISKYYQLLDIIGEGATSKTQKCLNIGTNELRAVKIISKNFYEDEELRLLPQEIETLKEMDHPNIIKPYEIFEDEKYIYIVTELCTGGELFDWITANPYISEADISLIMRQILSALSFCNGKKIMHRDLKPENILLDGDSNECLHIKIIDFGTAVIFEPGKKSSALCGTPYYIAPEVLRKKYDYRCDIWSAGVIMHILLVGYPPFNGATDYDIIKQILLGKISFGNMVWASVSDNAKDLLNKMIQVDVDKRITLEEAIKHPFFSTQGEKVASPKFSEAIGNLVKYNATQKLQKTAISFISNQLVSKQEKEELKKVFLELDVNGDGTLSIQELKEGITSVYGHNPNMESNLMEVIQKIDIDQDQKIQYSEFIMATLEREKLIQGNRIQQAFDAFDINHDGVISASEIKLILSVGQKFNDETWQRIIDEVDINKDGVISYDEFETMLLKFIQ